MIDLGLKMTRLCKMTMYMKLEKSVHKYSIYIYIYNTFDTLKGAVCTFWKNVVATIILQFPVSVSTYSSRDILLSLGLSITNTVKIGPKMRSLTNIELVIVHKSPKSSYRNVCLLQQCSVCFSSHSLETGK